MVQGICDVCRLTLNDATIKEVKFCAICSAWICEKCEFSPRRILAYIKSKGITMEEFKRRQSG